MSIRDRRIVFPSLSQPNIRYTAHGDGTFLYEQCKRGNPIACWAGLFDTYGDADVQHSHESAVQRDLFGDYCASLATWLLAHPEDVEVIACRWPRAVDVQELLFLAGLRFNEGKRRWYKKAECKVSAADSRRHDKRWEEVPTWADGSFSAIMAMKDLGGLDFIVSYAITVDAQEMLGRVLGSDAPYVNIASHFKLTEKHAHHAFVALTAVVEAYRQMEEGKRLVEQYADNVRYDRERAQAATA